MTGVTCVVINLKNNTLNGHFRGLNQGQSFWHWVWLKPPTLQMPQKLKLYNMATLSQ